jgi:hypothetical protein
VTLGADIEAALPELRTAAESMMKSTCVIRRVTGTELDEETLNTTPTYEVSYSGRCRVRFASTAAPREVDAQSQLLVEQEPILHLPVVGSEGVRVGDVAEITANPHDPKLVGVRFRVAGVHSQTLGTARRFPIEVVTES